MEQEIAAFLRERGFSLAADADLKAELLSGGNSHVTWRVRVTDSRSGRLAHDLVVKVAQRDGPLAPYDVGHEYEMMQFANATSIPTPQPIGYSTSADESKMSFIVMGFVDGDVPSLSTLQRWLGKRGNNAAQQHGRALIRTLQRLRAARPPGCELIVLSEHYRNYIADAAARLSEAAQGILDVPKSVSLTTTWLESRCADLDDGAACLVHGDFRVGNIAFREGRVVAVLDWERAMIGHPMHDVGYLCLPGMHFGERICGLITEQELAEIWLEEMATPFDAKQCALFKIMSIYTELCSMLRVMARLAKGVGRIEVLRPLPLIVKLNADLLTGMRSWDRGEYAL